MLLDYIWPAIQAIFGIGGLITLVCAAFVLSKAGTLKETAKGWEELARQRKETIDDFSAEVKELEAKIGRMDMECERQLTELGGRVGRIEAENTLLRELNLKGQRHIIELDDKYAAAEKRYESAVQDNLRLATDYGAMKVQLMQMDSTLKVLQGKLVPA